MGSAMRFSMRISLRVDRSPVLALKCLLRFLIEAFRLARVARREVKHHQFPGLGGAAQQPGLTRGQMIAPGRLILVLIEEGRFTEEEVRVVCERSDTSGIVRAVEGIDHIGKLLPARLFHQKTTHITERKVTALLLSILGLPAGGDHEIIGLAATEGLL